VSRPSGGLIALEGCDGVGKSVQAALLARALGAELTREPGGTAVGEAVRRLVLSEEVDVSSARAEALLMLAARAEHVERVVRPALERGRWVVTDRFSASTLAYQGLGRGLDVGELARLDRFATGGLTATLNVLLDVPEEKE
jgi:dTMP kinase